MRLPHYIGVYDPFIHQPTEPRNVLDFVVHLYVECTILDMHEVPLLKSTAEHHGCPFLFLISITYKGC